MIIECEIIKINIIKYFFKLKTRLIVVYRLTIPKTSNFKYNKIGVI